MKSVKKRIIYLGKLKLNNLKITESLCFIFHTAEALTAIPFIKDKLNFKRQLKKIKVIL